METEADDNVLDYWRLPNENYVVKLKSDNDLGGDEDVRNTLPNHLGAFILRNSKRIINEFIEINGIYKKIIHYSDTYNLYIEKKF